jgi:hypothetical protein
VPRSRARVITLRRRRDPGPWLAWLVLLAALTASIVAADAQGGIPALLPPGAGGTQQFAPITPPPAEHPDVPTGAARDWTEAPRPVPDLGIGTPPDAQGDAQGRDAHVVSR